MFLDIVIVIILFVFTSIALLLLLLLLLLFKAPGSSTLNKGEYILLELLRLGKTGYY